MDIFDHAIQLADEHPGVNNFHVRTDKNAYEIEVSRGEGVELSAHIYILEPISHAAAHSSTEGATSHQ